MESDQTFVNRLFVVAFAGFVAAILFSVAGTLLLNASPQRAAQALGWIYQNLGLRLEDLVKGPTWIYMILMPLLTFLLYLPILGIKRSVLFFLFASVIGAAAELLGTQTGFPFGHYTYTNLLGAQIAGHVPWLIPPSWYAMALLSYDLARRVTSSTAGIVMTTAIFMVLWDVALDPAMTAGAHSGWSFWWFEGGGIFFGMPLVNWAGWLGTSAVIAYGFEKWLGGMEGEASWAPLLWSVNVAFPVFILFAYGAALAGVLGLVAMAIPLILIRRHGSSVLPRRRPEVATA